MDRETIIHDLAVARTCAKDGHLGVQAFLRAYFDNLADIEKDFDKELERAKNRSERRTSPRYTVLDD